MRREQVRKSKSSRLRPGFDTVEPIVTERTRMQHKEYAAAVFHDLESAAFRIDEILADDSHSPGASSD
jgi:hypothetical protein